MCVPECIVCVPECIVCVPECIVCVPECIVCVPECIVCVPECIVCVPECIVCVPECIVCVPECIVCVPECIVCVPECIVSNIARTCYFELRRLAYIRRFLTSTATATLVSAFVLSRIDYCNSLLFGSTLDVTSHLQRIQNYAARVILRLPMSSRITIHLKSLHWLPVKVRSTYKIACLCYHCHSSTAPSYVTDMLHKKPLHTRNTRSSSSPCLFSIDMHTVRQHLVIVHFLLLPLLSGTLFQMMSSVPHHCHHLSLV